MTSGGAECPGGEDFVQRFHVFVNAGLASDKDVVP